MRRALTSEEEAALRRQGNDTLPIDPLDELIKWRGMSPSAIADAIRRTPESSRDALPHDEAGAIFNELQGLQPRSTSTGNEMQELVPEFNDDDEDDLSSTKPKSDEALLRLAQADTTASDGIESWIKDFTAATGADPHDPVPDPSTSSDWADEIDVLRGDAELAQDARDDAADRMHGAVFGRRPRYDGAEPLVAILGEHMNSRAWNNALKEGLAAAPSIEDRRPQQEKPMASLEDLLALAGPRAGAGAGMENNRKIGTMARPPAPANMLEALRAAMQNLGKMPPTAAPNDFAERGSVPLDLRRADVVNRPVRDQSDMSDEGLLNTVQKGISGTSDAKGGKQYDPDAAVNTMIADAMNSDDPKAALNELVQDDWITAEKMQELLTQ